MDAGRRLAHRVDTSGKGLLVVGVSDYKSMQQVWIEEVNGVRN